MISVLHILIALSSIILSTFAFFTPSRHILYISYGLVGLTFTSGIYLVYTAPSHMVEACISGVVYLGIVSLALVAAKQKLTAQEATR